ncbi:MAG: hypothetical protein HY289_14795 [Planctomycetes bacterium]|nr:hypothetical protein [Planctomycetota bacterium]
MSIFRWDTIREVRPHDLHYESPMKGWDVEVEMTSGVTILAWRAEDGQQYFCHGLTFGGIHAPGGVISPFSGRSVEAILADHFDATAEVDARTGDIVVWVGTGANSTPHSAILTHPLLDRAHQILDEMTRVQSKNGMAPEANLTLAELFEKYGESYIVFRAR